MSPLRLRIRGGVAYMCERDAGGAGRRARMHDSSLDLVRLDA
jgi:hypothetical protein